MKKMLLIDLLVCAVLCLAFIGTRNEKTICNMHCCSAKKNVKPVEDKVTGGSDTEDQLFQFNRIFIKL